ncbi:L-fucose isomerase _2 domain protein [Caldicellulosiruptor hydrothermalis 108]|uniref:L-fucose isomerase_2 domain protein n=1 Tax=Caldicellulosiruptor hydrothermalis (strain DSM 18901 / VKM B-2411 / 108) TaxID=632292 RepID=E4QDA7_CALH1|nr:L-fucose/L-arabinose isomerase family protein [Caldicellulosiruptor hydrothermalis]ADQ06402.1 L-fucose isomerase _2 domain protein [Caldicellulosiruptor hydrothermalis 108]
MFDNSKKSTKPRIGLYSVGLKAYWAQFDGLRERLIGYGKFIESKLSDYGEVYNYGLVDDEKVARQAGEWFNSKNVDIIFCHSATYCTSSCVLPVHQICKAPVIILNLQPTAQMNYEKTSTGEWLAHCGACPVPEFANAFNRANIRFKVVNGLLGQSATPKISVTDENTAHRPEAIRAWNEIIEWTRAAGVKRVLQHARFGFLGNNYSGMLDMYNDFTLAQAQFGIHVEILEMCDLIRFLETVTDEEVEAKIKEIEEFFQIVGDSPSDPIAKKPTEEQLKWSAKVACAQEKMVKEYELDGLAYYYHGAEGNYYEQVQSAFIVGHSLLTAKGVPCAGEGDLKTAIAMKICDILGTGGSFSEIVATDYELGTIIMGHDGPFHIKISDGKPILRDLKLYHGKKGTGVSVEAKVKAGPVTLLAVTQTGDRKMKMITTEGEAIKAPILMIGNTQTHIKFKYHPDEFMGRWFNEYPTHHWAISVGHNASLFEKVAYLLDVECAKI